MPKPTQIYEIVNVTIPQTSYLMFQGGRTAGQAGPQEQAHRKEDPGGAPGIGGGKSGVFFWVAQFFGRIL
jgi:hypothetical protein